MTTLSIILSTAIIAISVTIGVRSLYLTARQTCQSHHPSSLRRQV